MAEHSFPWDGTGLGHRGPYDYDFGWEMLASRYLDTTLLDSYGPIAGRYNELEVRPTAPNGMAVIVRSGQAMLVSGWYYNDSNLELPIAPNPAPAAGGRYDLVVLRTDWAARTTRLAIHEGVAGGGIPITTQIWGTTWEVPLAAVRIGEDATEIESDDIWDMRGMVNRRMIILGIGDFEVDPGDNPATLSTFGGTNSVGWELTNGSTDQVFAIVHIPSDWGETRMLCTARIWNYTAGILITDAVIFSYRQYHDDNPPHNFNTWANPDWDHMAGAGLYLDHLPNVSGGGPRIASNRVLEIRVQLNSWGQDFWLLGMILEFWRGATINRRAPFTP